MNEWMNGWMNEWVFVWSQLSLMSVWESRGKNWIKRPGWNQHTSHSVPSELTPPDSITSVQSSTVSKRSIPQLTSLCTKFSSWKPIEILLGAWPKYSFICNESGECKALGQAQARPFVPGPLTCRLHCQPSEPLSGALDCSRLLSMNRGYSKLERISHPSLICSNHSTISYRE